jgi:hypothetical protein
MQYYKRHFGTPIRSRGWEYYRLHSDGCYDYWHPGIGWCEPVSNNWRIYLLRCPSEYVEISEFEILVTLGVRALKGETNED